jgi:hypothetical protein
MVVFGHVVCHGAGRRRRNRRQFAACVALEEAAVDEHGRAACGRLEHLVDHHAGAAVAHLVVEHVGVPWVEAAALLDQRIAHAGLAACLLERHRRLARGTVERGEQRFLLVRAPQLPGAECDEQGDAAECRDDRGRMRAPSH